MTELPTRAQMFANCLSPLDTARGSLSEVRDWLRSDWRPLGASLTPEAGEARAAILDTLTETKNLIDTMKRRITEAIDSLPAE